MASLIKDGGLRGHKTRSEFVRKPPSKTFIIPADELVQVIAKVCLLLLLTCELIFSVLSLCQCVTWHYGRVITLRFDILIPCILMLVLGSLHI